MLNWRCCCFCVGQCSSVVIPAMFYSVTLKKTKCMKCSFINTNRCLFAKTKNILYKALRIFTRTRTLSCTYVQYTQIHKRLLYAVSLSPSLLYLFECFAVQFIVNIFLSMMPVSIVYAYVHKNHLILLKYFHKILLIICCKVSLVLTCFANIQMPPMCKWSCCCRSIQRKLRAESLGNFANYPKRI